MNILLVDYILARNRNESLQFCFNMSDDVSFGSDLALRNCLLTSEMSVKIGDYGLSHTRYKVRTLPTFPIHTSALKFPARDAILFSLFCRMTTTSRKTRSGCLCVGLHPS